jgi:UDP-3-O-acyl-N-acetylglucosamine deacetylase
MKFFLHQYKGGTFFRCFNSLIGVNSLENQDLELAKQKLISEDLSLVIVKNQKVIFKTKKQGVSGFLQAIEKLNQNLAKSSIADKIVGVAAAMLCVYSDVSAVFAQTISEGGIKVLENNNILHQFEKNVSYILNRNKTDVCPFEKKAISCTNPREAYENLKDLTTQMTVKSKESSD